jgi:hypothetical protein
MVPMYVHASGISKSSSFEASGTWNQVTTLSLPFEVHQLSSDHSISRIFDDTFEEGRYKKCRKELHKTAGKSRKAANHGRSSLFLVFDLKNDL